MRDNHRQPTWNSIIYGAVFCFVLSLLWTTSVGAQSYDWIGSELNIEQVTGASVNTERVVENMAHPCVKRSVTTYNPYINKLEILELCVITAKSFTLAYVTSCIPNWYNSCDNRSWMVIGFPYSDRMYRVEGLNPGYYDLCWQASPEADAIYYTCSASFVSVKDLPQHLTHSLDRGGAFFTYDGSTYDYVYDERATVMLDYSNKGATISRNGNWAVIAFPGRGLVRLDLKHGTIKLFTKTITASGYGSDPWYNLAITDDGRYVAVAGMNTNFFFYEITDDCGEDASLLLTAWADRYAPYSGCPERGVTGRIITNAGSPDAGYRWVWPIAFSDDEGQLIGKLTPYRADARWFTLSTTEYTPPAQLDYLAIGDSFSSGEGDTETINNTDVKWYRDGTDNKGDNGLPSEMCHVSLRSYPYLLAREMDLGIDNGKPWRSIACSGASAWDVKAQASDVYVGQRDRLKGYDVASLKATALNDFIPGRQKQIEFVKKYKPKAITLTMGGNDVDFGGKIADCAQWPDTCVFATQEWRGELKNELKSQYKNLSDLYRELIDASPGTKVYVLGYPQFINGDPRAACTNTFNLNMSERELIVNSIIYLNNIIEMAAKSVGVNYVDIENAIGGHRLCDDNEKHVTAITNIFGANGNNRQEAFHPNHLGNIDIVNEFLTHFDGVDMIAYDFCQNRRPSCPDTSVTADSAVVPPYFGIVDAEEDMNLIYYKLTNGTLIKAESIFTDGKQAYLFKPDTKVSLTLYSEPVELGSYNVDSDGRIVAGFIIPNDIPTGYHTLVMEGLSFSGEPMKLYQVVEVRAADRDDIDGDGISNAEDSCTYSDLCPGGGETKTEPTPHDTAAVHGGGVPTSHTKLSSEKNHRIATEDYLAIGAVDENVPDKESQGQNLSDDMTSSHGQRRAADVINKPVVIYGGAIVVVLVAALITSLCFRKNRRMT